MNPDTMMSAMPNLLKDTSLAGATKDLTGFRNHLRQANLPAFLYFYQSGNTRENLSGQRCAPHVAGSRAQVWSGVRGGAMLITPNTNSLSAGRPASSNTFSLLPSVGL